MRERKRVFGLAILILILVAGMIFFTNLPTTGRVITGNTVGTTDGYNQLASVTGITPEPSMTIERYLERQENENYKATMLQALQEAGFNTEETLEETLNNRGEEFIIVFSELHNNQNNKLEEKENNEINEDNEITNTIETLFNLEDKKDYYTIEYLAGNYYKGQGQTKEAYLHHLENTGITRHLTIEELEVTENTELYNQFIQETENFRTQYTNSNDNNDETTTDTVNTETTEATEAEETTDNTEIITEEDIPEPTRNKILQTLGITKKETPTIIQGTYKEVIEDLSLEEAIIITEEIENTEENTIITYNTETKELYTNNNDGTATKTNLQTHIEKIEITITEEDKEDNKEETYYDEYTDSTTQTLTEETREQFTEEKGTLENIEDNINNLLNSILKSIRGNPGLAGNNAGGNKPLILQDASEEDKQRHEGTGWCNEPNDKTGVLNEEINERLQAMIKIRLIETNEEAEEVLTQEFKEKIICQDSCKEGKPCEGKVIVTEKENDPQTKEAEAACVCKKEIWPDTNKKDAPEEKPLLKEEGKKCQLQNPEIVETIIQDYQWNFEPYWKVEEAYESEDAYWKEVEEALDFKHANNIECSGQCPNGKPCEGQVSVTRETSFIASEAHYENKVTLKAACVCKKETQEETNTNKKNTPEEEPNTKITEQKCEPPRNKKDIETIMLKDLEEGKTKSETEGGYGDERDIGILASKLTNKFKNDIQCDSTCKNGIPCQPKVTIKKDIHKVLWFTTEILIPEANCVCETTTKGQKAPDSTNTDTTNSCGGVIAHGTITDLTCPANGCTVNGKTGICKTGTFTQIATCNDNLEETKLLDLLNKKVSDGLTEKEREALNEILEQQTTSLNNCENHEVSTCYCDTETPTTNNPPATPPTTGPASTGTDTETEETPAQCTDSSFSLTGQFTEEIEASNNFKSGSSSCGYKVQQALAACNQKFSTLYATKKSACEQTCNEQGGSCTTASLEPLGDVCFIARACYYDRGDDPDEGGSWKATVQTKPLSIQKNLACDCGTDGNTIPTGTTSNEGGSGGSTETTSDKGGDIPARLPDEKEEDDDDDEQDEEKPNSCNKRITITKGNKNIKGTGNAFSTLETAKRISCTRAKGDAATNCNTYTRGRKTITSRDNLLCTKACKEKGNSCTRGKPITTQTTCTEQNSCTYSGIRTNTCRACGPLGTSVTATNFNTAKTQLTCACS